MSDMSVFEDDNEEEIQSTSTSKGIIKNTFRISNKVIVTVIVAAIAIVTLLVLANNYNKKQQEIKSMSSVDSISSDVLKKEKVEESLKAIKPYESKLMDQVLSKKKAAKNFNTRSSGVDEYKRKLNDYKSSCQAKLASLTKLKVHSDTEKYKNNVISEYNDFITGAAHELNCLSAPEGNKSELQTANKCYDDLITIYKDNQTVYETLKKSTK